MCRAVPDLHMVKENVIELRHSLHVLEHLMHSQSAQQEAGQQLIKITEQVKTIQRLLDVQETESKERVTIQKFA